MDELVDQRNTPSKVPNQHLNIATYLLDGKLLFAQFVTVMIMSVIR